jgi:hypothetical protein
VSLSFAATRSTMTKGDIIQVVIFATLVAMVVVTFVFG